MEDAIKMIRSYDYFDVLNNRGGKGIKNVFELLPGDSVVHDSTTQLFWQQSGSDRSMSFEKSLAYIDSLNVVGYADSSDWRLPTLEEAMSLMELVQNEAGLFVDPIFNKTQQRIWTADKQSASYAWVVDFCYGSCAYHSVSFNIFVRAVRWGQSVIWLFELLGHLKKGKS